MRRWRGWWGSTEGFEEKSSMYSPVRRHSFLFKTKGIDFSTMPLQIRGCATKRAFLSCNIPQESVKGMLVEATEVEFIWEITGLI